MRKENKNSTLEAANLAIGYLLKKKKEIQVSKNINFSLQKGELVGLVGSNGIGKSTLLRTLTAMQPKLNGSIIINQQDSTTLSNIQLSTKISVVLTEAPSTTNLSVYELVALGRYPYTNWIGKLTRSDKQFIEEALQATEVLKFAQKKCFELSDGQLQRVLIARALAQDTPIIVLDEPTTHLDLYHRAYVLKLLKKLASEKEKTILFSTHEIDLAIHTCDKMIVMTPDKVYFNTPDMLIKQECFSGLFPSEIIAFNTETRTFSIKK